MENYIRFDWAIKRILRDKANQDVLEGFLTVLLGMPIHIVRFLESEGNQDDGKDKFNRVDILAEAAAGEQVIIEVQNNHELDYFHRMLYGTSKVVTDYMGIGDPYRKIRKIYSVNIVYFELGQGSDYVYHGKSHFIGLHEPHDELMLSERQKELFKGKAAGDIFPEYYVLRVNDFDRVATTPLDEWMRFLKTGDIKPTDTAPGLSAARDKLRLDRLSPADKRAYLNHMESLRYQTSVISTGYDDGMQKGLEKGEKIGLQKGKEIGIKKGMELAQKQARQKMLEVVHNLRKLGLSDTDIAKATGLTEEQLPS